MTETDEPELSTCKCGTRPKMTIWITFSFPENKEIPRDFRPHCPNENCEYNFTVNPHIKKGSAIRAWNKLCLT